MERKPLVARCRTTIDSIRLLLRTARRECDDEACVGWAVFESGRGLEIERCDTCCPAELGDDDVGRLPEAKRALREAKAFAAVRWRRDLSPLMKRWKARDEAEAMETDLVEDAIADAAHHGRESDDPDHEVGDLQQLVRLLARHLGPEHAEVAMREWSPWQGDDEP